MRVRGFLTASSGPAPSTTQFSHQAVATALLVALACLLMRSFDRESPSGLAARC